MKKSIFTVIASVVITLSAGAQGKSIVVANPSVSGLFATSEIASKILRLETVKLEKYNVYDEFDMVEAYNSDSTLESNCYSKNCLVRLGTALNVDYALSGSFDKLGNKIVITLKMIDVKNNTLYMSKVREFDDQEQELQRMAGIVLEEMHGIETDKELTERLKFNDELVTSNNVGKVNNSGPRIGVAFMTGNLVQYAEVMDMAPVVSMIGYQFEAQYIGTEKFSALAEFVVNISGMEQGEFIPSLSILNGLRFGSKGYEIAFGPSFGLTKAIGTSRLEGTTAFIFAGGRTFRAGALNMPVNIFYSSRKGGGYIGTSVGFNVQKSKKPINPRI